MDIQELLDVINGARDRDLRLYFTHKKNRFEFESFEPGVGNNLQQELLDMAIKTLEKSIEVEQREYSPIGVIEGTIETCQVNELTNFPNLLESFEDEVINPRITGEDIDNLNFYCMKIKIQHPNLDEEEIYLFRRITKFKKLRKGIVGKFQDNNFEKISSELLGIDDLVDVVVFRNEMLILSHISLERIFAIQDQFNEMAERTLNIVEQSNRIANFTQFKEDCLQDGRVTRSLTKILKEENRIEQSFINFDNMITAVGIFELDITFDQNNTVLVYEDKSQLMDIVRLIRDSFYRSIVNEREGIDEGI